MTHIMLLEQPSCNFLREKWPYFAWYLLSKSLSGQWPIKAWTQYTIMVEKTDPKVTLAKFEFQFHLTN